MGQERHKFVTTIKNAICTGLNFYSIHQIFVCLQAFADQMAKAIDVSNVQSKKDIVKVKDIQDLWMRFSSRLEYRLKLGKMYFDFHRHRQLVGAKCF